jgi:K+-transporting ATPase KdpF subunit
LEGEAHVGRGLLRHSRGVLRGRSVVYASLRSRRRNELMSLEFLLSGVAAALVLVYLVYALLRPERF